MSLQLLISTLNNKNILGLLDSLNVQSDAIVINQCDINECKIINYKDNNINVYNFSERGVGLSRNNALMRSTADFCLLTDDDMTYIDGYSQIVHNMFLKHPQADVIVFNLEENNNRYVIKKKFKVGYLNYMRFGAARIAIRRQSVIKNGISFNLCFGGGTPHGSGEDVLFLKDCIK